MIADLPVEQYIPRETARRRYILLRWSLAGALLADALWGALQLGWCHGSPLWPFLPGALAAVLLGRWLFRASSITDQAVARGLDAHWDLHARLESAVELADRDSAFALAQREEATSTLRGKKPEGRLYSYIATAAIILGALCIAAEGIAFAWKLLADRSHAPVAQKAEIKPEGSITWKAPDDQIMASAIEEVPLKALARSNTGFRTLSLEVDVNGAHILSRPIAASAAAPGGRTFNIAGSADAETSLFLDELNVKPFDVVSYHLEGTLNSTHPVPAVASPLQFIQVRPSQRNLQLNGGGGDGRLLSLIRQLKGEQMQLLQENFALLHAADMKTQPVWISENKRVAHEQSALVDNANRAIALADGQNAPPLIEENLRATLPLIKSASEDIYSTHNDAATREQGQVVALLAELEKLVVAAAGGAPVASDPFRDDQHFDLPPREATPAGELEKLARRQQQNNQQAGKQSGSAPSDGSGAADEQASIARDASALAAGGKVDPAAQGALAEAAKAAEAAARQFAANDPGAAREPAAAAEQGFGKALAAQASAARTAAMEVLDSVRRELNQAGRPGASARSATLEQVRTELLAAAARQQQVGSAEAAGSILALARAVQAPKSATADISRNEPNTAARAQDLAAAAARLYISFSPRTAALNRAIRQLRSTQGNLSDKSEPSGPALQNDLATAELRAQESSWLTADPKIGTLGQSVASLLGDAQRGVTPLPPTEKEAAAKAISTLAAALEAARDSGQRDELVRKFSPEDVDPFYRPAVESYFERLSRDGAPH